MVPRNSYMINKFLLILRPDTRYSEFSRFLDFFRNSRIQQKIHWQILMSDDNTETIVVFISGVA